MDGLHHLLQLSIDLLSSPDQTLGVLSHLQTGDANATGVNSLGRSNDHVLLSAQEVQSIVGGGHIGDLDVVLNTGGSDLLGPLQVDIVLHCGGHVDIHVLDAPSLGVGNELAAELVSIGLAVHGILSAHLEDEVQLLIGDNAIGIVDVAIGTCEVGNSSAQLSSLLHDTPTHVAVAGDSNALALDGVVLMSENFLQIVHSTVTGSLGTDQGAAVGQALTGENAVLPHALQATILTIQVADLTAANAHVTGGNVDIGTNVAIQSRHEALAETHDLGVGLAGGIEVGTALGAAQRQAGQAVLEGLLKAQELDDALINVLLEAQAALVGADSAVELAAPAAVGVPLTIVVAPHNTEGEHTLRLDHTAQQVDLLILGMSIDHRLQRGQHFLDGLDELGLIAVLGLHILQHASQISIHNNFLLKFLFFVENYLTTDAMLPSS